MSSNENKPEDNANATDGLSRLKQARRAPPWGFRNKPSSALARPRVNLLVFAAIGTLGLIAILSALGRRGSSKIVENSIGMEFRMISRGEFRMGLGEFVEDERQDAKPIHVVQFEEPFYMGVHEVTQQAFSEIMGVNPSQSAEQGAEMTEGAELEPGDSPLLRPVENVTWLEADEFCKRLSEKSAEKKAGRSYRLPTEAEWEYACRAGSTTAFSTGVDLKPTEANFSSETPGEPAGEGEKRRKPGRLRQVKSYPANAFELFDMHGNVAEWCADWYDDRYYARARKVDPRGPKNGRERVVRGGSWSDVAGHCRSALRDHARPTSRDPRRGFRVVLMIQVQAK